MRSCNCSPWTKSRREETYLRHAFAGLALDSPELREHQRRFNKEMVIRAATAIANGMRCGGTAPVTDSNLEAHALLALVDGLAAPGQRDRRGPGAGAQGGFGTHGRALSRQLLPNVTDLRSCLSSPPGARPGTAAGAGGRHRSPRAGSWSC